MSIHLKHWRKGFYSIAGYALLASASVGLAFQNGNGKSNEGYDLVDPKEKIEVQVVTVTPTGIYPTKISRPPGAFTLFLENRTGFRKALTIHVEAADKTLAKIIDIAEKQSEQGTLLRLVPGKYTVRIPNQAGSTLEIEVRAK